ncbi:MAG: valine--tRNA ligase [Candidatus Altiarchaeales archaeon]|nr:valine--tRNA ligase [Candidatus Altiarchaeales archaeon]MBD3416051.1 valine--tRNA ligase [Candidatus Altiarchaeales archaeon]
MAGKKKYDPREAEPRWQRLWEEDQVYRFDPDAGGAVYSVDTPPPTVSGKMHLGHAFSYSQQDFIVRYKRMRGYNIFYPFGTDDNGIPTERLVEKMKKVRARDMERQDFIKLCLRTLEEELRPKYIEDWKRIGMSCDWNVFYTTINEHCQRISQKSFIDLYGMGREYRKDAPTMWCPECQTGISQVECEDKELESSFNDIIFKVDGEDLVIATTRPELLPACVAVFYHPDDERYKKHEGREAKVPLFDINVPILPDPRADPEKGTGIVMCCTFGDQTDMEWQKAHELPIKVAISPDGRMTGQAERYEGLKVKEARERIIGDLKEAGLLVKQEKILHPVNVHERCGTEIEYLKSKQWFIRYLDLKDEMLEWGYQLNWHPEHMRHRFDHWVKGLQWDWLISRQRYFGVPFPVWYCSECEAEVLARAEDLPVDPLVDNPPVDKCPNCGCKEFTPEEDVLDTWATSSLTPHLSADLYKDHPIYEKIYPMSLRPQAHDIITFWLFNTVVKSRMHDRVNPWADVVISGHAQDPHGRKMSKSKGNVIEPQEMLEKYSADSLRFWAAGCKLGDDLPFSEKDLVTGEKFITKIWNASRFVFMHLEDYDGKDVELEDVDRWLLTKLSKIIAASTESFDKYEYSRTKSEVEKFFWQTFCDYYLEIVKQRLYKPELRGEESRRAAQHVLYHALLAVVKMMAPIMPHITEEIYQTYYRELEGSKSVHVSAWPDEGLVDEEAERKGDLLVEAVALIRKVKSDNQLSLGKEVEKAKITGSKDQLDMLKPLEADVKGTGKIGLLEYEVGDGLSVSLS